MPAAKSRTALLQYGGLSLCLVGAWHAGLLGCATLPSEPVVEFPAPYEQDGLRISVEGFYGTGRSYFGINGTAKNIGSKDYTMCMINFDIVDSQGTKVGDAVAHTQGLKAGQEWRFQALFTTAFATTFKSIRPGRVTAMGTVEDLVAEAKAKAMASQPTPSAPLVGRTMGIHCDQRLPSGDMLPLITAITKDGLAEKAGWNVGDLILSVDEVKVRTLTDVVVATQQGSKSKTYTLQRGEEIIKSTLTFP
jgi:hypothetical protein